jgi:hypothetical protein
MNTKLTNEHLRRRAIVYIRQSSPGQVLYNQESQRRQYNLADRARELGFRDVTVIDMISGAPAPVWSNALDSSGLLPRSVPER